MMGELITRNLLHRPLRTLIGVIAVAVEVALVVLIVGLTSGLLTETAKRIEGIGADIMLQPPAASIFLGFSGSPMPIKIGDKLSEMKYVQAVAPALLQFSSTGGVDVVYGIDRDSFREVSGGFVFLEGHDMEGPDDLLVDDWAAKAKRIRVGDTYNLLNHGWHVTAIIEHGKGARLFVPLSTLQELVGAHRRRDGTNSRRPARLHHSSTEGFSIADDLNKHPGSANVHQRDDRAGHFDRPAGYFSDDVHDGDRANTGHRRAEITRCESTVHRPRAPYGIRGALFLWHSRGRRPELCGSGGICCGLPDALHSHHARMDHARRGHCVRRSAFRSELSGVVGKPQGCG